MKCFNQILFRDFNYIPCQIGPIPVNKLQSKMKNIFKERKINILYCHHRL